jgi:hypothetical protein
VARGMASSSSGVPWSRIGWVASSSARVASVVVRSASRVWNRSRMCPVGGVGRVGGLQLGHEPVLSGGDVVKAPRKRGAQAAPRSCLRPSRAARHLHCGARFRLDLGPLLISSSLPTCRGAASRA